MTSRYTREIHTHGINRYDGGKGGAGVVQRLINSIPPHQTYIEAFAGSAALFRAKAPAASSFLIERDPKQAELLRHHSAHATVLEADSLEILSSLVAKSAAPFVYLDPPYLHSTRRDRSIYRYELSDEDHARLLELLSSIKTPWILSGYRSSLYDDAAARHGWKSVDYRCMTRRGPVIETMWLNFEPQELHQYNLLGQGFRERERIKRKVSRWVHKLKALPSLEQKAILVAMNSEAGHHEC